MMPQKLAKIRKAFVFKCETTPSKPLHFHASISVIYRFRRIWKVLNRKRSLKKRIEFRQKSSTLARTHKESFSAREIIKSILSGSVSSKWELNCCQIVVNIIQSTKNFWIIPNKPVGHKRRSNLKLLVWASSRATSWLWTNELLVNGPFSEKNCQELFPSSSLLQNDSWSHIYLI